MHRLSRKMSEAGAYVSQTGGGCTALMIPLKGRMAVVTDLSGLKAPAVGRKALVGVYRGRNEEAQLDAWSSDEGRIPLHVTTYKSVAYLLKRAKSFR